MAARAGPAQGEVLISQEAWEALAADPQLLEFKRRHGVELRVQGRGRRGGQCSVCLTLQPPAPWHQEAQVRDQLIGLCNDRRGQRAAAEGPSERLDPCPICLGEMRDPKPLGRCGHSFCRPCIDQAFRTRPACPLCGHLYGVVTGNQPLNASMTVTKDKSLHLPGYEDSGTILITYYIPGGTQGAEHPNPGQSYQGTTRQAYLPDCKDGQKVCRLLKKAFDQRLIFTIGTSRTTGRDNVVTWNDIHHKTNPWGGPKLFGYPDPLYLTRVQQELGSKGITVD